jgi:hypothetical protein
VCEVRGGEDHGHRKRGGSKGSGGGSGIVEVKVATGLQVGETEEEGVAQPTLGHGLSRPF